jgi:hypothetical protein
MLKHVVAVMVAVLVLMGFVPSSLAWNKAGHMVSAAIAYTELKQGSPEALARVVALLKLHPEFSTRWAPELAKRFVPANERDLYLFMLAARWPDDIRGDESFDHSAWHFINLPYKPQGQPASVQPVDPPPENILSAYGNNLAIVRDTGPDSERAVALAWLFHLTGDVHQPLHTVTLFTTQFPTAEGDRGGTRFYIRVLEGRSTISLHAFWDGLVLGSERFQTVRNTATSLRLRPAHARAQLPELAQKEFDQWARQESVTLAQEQVYRNGSLQGSTDKRNGTVLPADYAGTAKPIGERRLVLAGYRLADVLKQLFER